MSLFLHARNFGCHRDLTSCSYHLSSSKARALLSLVSGCGMFSLKVDTVHIAPASTIQELTCSIDGDQFPGHLSVDNFMTTFFKGTFAAVALIDNSDSLSRHAVGRRQLMHMPSAELMEAASRGRKPSALATTIFAPTVHPLIRQQIRLICFRLSTYSRNIPLDVSCCILLPRRSALKTTELEIVLTERYPKSRVAAKFPSYNGGVNYCNNLHLISRATLGVYCFVDLISNISRNSPFHRIPPTFGNQTDRSAIFFPTA